MSRSQLMSVVAATAMALAMATAALLGAGQAVETAHDYTGCPAGTMHGWHLIEDDPACKSIITTLRAGGDSCTDDARTDSRARCQSDIRRIVRASASAGVM